jgi:hypothetical protein
MVIQLQHRRATAAAWTAANPTLAEGEWGYETDSKKYKVGTGAAAWIALPYVGVQGVIYDYITLDPMGCMIPTTNPASVDQAETGAGTANYVYGLFTYAGVGAAGTGNCLQWKVILPEDWTTAGLVSAKVHWLPTAGTVDEYVKWQIDAVQLADGDLLSTAFASLGTCEDQLLATPAGKVHLSPACTPQAINGTAGSEIIFRVTRIAAQATASDQDIRLLGVSIKYIRTLS